MLPGLDHRAQVGKTVEVLVEGLSRHGRRADGPVDQLTGRSMTDHIVVFDGPDRLIGRVVAVRVEDASPFTLYGTVRTGETVGVTGDAAGEPPRPPVVPRYSLPLA